MKKWVWSFSFALLVWAVGLKFSPEETIGGSFIQLRFEGVSLLFGGFIGLMFGLATGKGKSVVEEKRKFLYFALACSSIGFLLTFGPSFTRAVLASLIGAAVGLVIAGTNYFWAKKH